MAKITEVKLKHNKKIANVIGTEKVTRPEAVKKLWKNNKKEDLQDSKNRRQINADSKLLPLFGKDSITMFEVGKIIAANLK